MTREFYANTWFIDIDGTIMIHKSNFDYDGSPDELLDGAKEFWDKIPAKDCIVLTTGRPSWWRQETMHSLERFGLRYDILLMDLPSGRRILINDCKPKSENYGNVAVSPMAFSRNVERDVGVNWDGLDMDNLISPPDTVIVAQKNETVIDSREHINSSKEHYYS